MFTVAEVLEDWTRDLVSRFDAVHLFDLAADPAVYRVFMMADHLQLDVSVAPASSFEPTSPRFKPLFGEANEPETAKPPSRDDALGWAVLWAFRRMHRAENWWHAEYSITQLRYHGMGLRAYVRACPRATAGDSISCPWRMVTRSNERSSDP